MGKNILWGVLGGAAVIGLAYAAAVKLHGGDAAVTQAVAATAIPAAQAKPTVLELRGVGLMVNGWGQTQVWSLIKGEQDAYKSVMSMDPKDYPNNTQSLNDDATIGLAAAFHASAGQGVERWPIPVIIFGPPQVNGMQNHVAASIAHARQSASLGIHLLTSLIATNVSNPQAQIDYLFDFFDQHPEVPEVLIVGMDGMSTRMWFGDKAPPEGRHVPTQFDAMVGLLVARTDRVDHYMRPYVTDDPSGAGMNDKEYDSIKLWNFFWDERDAYDRQYEQALEDKHYKGPIIGPGVPPTDWWQAQLPKLWATLTNKGPGDFKPSPWYPVRWAKWQLAAFDKAPLLGYLHRPVAVELKDAQGEALGPKARAEALAAGWATLAGELPQDGKAARVFFDSRAQPDVLPLLHQLEDADRLNPVDLKQGFDLGHRIGNLGMMAPMVGLSLSAMASYDTGHASVTANLTPDGKLHLMLVTPPTPAEKAVNADSRHLGADPFANL